MAALNPSMNRAAALRSRLDASALDGWAAAALVSFLALLFRLHGLGAQSLWGDEIASVELARMPLHLLWSGWMVRETNPPLYYSALHIWMNVFGRSETAVRSLSVLGGSCEVLLVYWLGRRVADRRVAMIGAVIAAFWIHPVHYSEEARGYIFGACGALLAAIGLCGLADEATGERGGGVDAGLYVGGCLLAVYTHTTLVLAPALASLYFAWLWAWRSPRQFRPILKCIALNAVVFLAWLWWGAITWRQLHLAQTNVSWIPRASVQHALGLLVDAYGLAPEDAVNSPLSEALRFGGAALVLGAAAFGLTRLRFERAVMLAVFGVGAPLALFLISQHTPIMLARTFLWADFAPLLAAATALATVRSDAFRLGMLGAICALLLTGDALDPPREPWRETVKAIAGQAKPGDTMLAASISTGVYLQYYCRLSGCSTPIEVLRRAGDVQNRWADGFFSGSMVSDEQARTLVRRGATVFAVSHWEDDPRPVLQPAARERPLNGLPRLPKSMTVTAWTTGKQKVS